LVGTDAGPAGLQEAILAAVSHETVAELAVAKQKNVAAAQEQPTYIVPVA